MVDGVDVRVAEVDSDGADGEAESAGAAPHDDGRVERVDEGREVAARRGVATRRRARTAARGLDGLGNEVEVIFGILEGAIM